MVRPPSRGSCLLLSPIVSLLAGCCLPLSRIVSHCPLLFPFVSHYLQSPFLFPFVGSCVRLPRSYLPLSPFVSPHVCLCCMVCPPLPGLISPCLLSSPHVCGCVGWCVRLPEVLSPIVSDCLPTCVPVLDDVSAFPRPCLPLSPVVSNCLPLSPIVSHSLPHMWAFPGSCLPLSPSLCSFLSPSLSPSLSLFLFPFVAGGLILHFSPNSVLLGVLNGFSCVWPCSWKHFLNPPTVWGLPWCN